MARRLLPAVVLALLALAPAAHAALSQTPHVTNTRHTSVLCAEHPVAPRGRASPSVQTVAGLIDRKRAGAVTNVALGAARALNYLAIALVVGVLLNLSVVVPPALLGGAFERRAWLLLAGGLALGAIVSVLGILLQGAETSGLSLWASLKSPIVSNVLASRFGWVWAVKALLFALSLGGLALRGRRAYRVWLAAVGAYLVATPALAGHASVQSPVWAFFPADVVHVLAASFWVGGIACIVFALPLATRAVEPAARTAVLIDALARFSPLALAAVAALTLTGALQAYIDVRSLSALTHSTYGELVLLKAGLLGLLIGLGTVNRERIMPALRRLLEAGASPGEAGAALRRSTRGELAAMAGVFGVTAALVSFAPPVDGASGAPRGGAQASRVRVRQAPAATHASSQITRIATARPALIVRPLLSGSASPGLSAPSAMLGITSRAEPRKLIIASSRPAITCQPISAVSETAREPVSEPRPTEITHSSASAAQTHATESNA